MPRRDALWCSVLKVKLIADDLYRGSLQFDRESPQNRSTIPPCSLDPIAYCLVNTGTLGMNFLPGVVARIMPRSELNPRPLDHESNALPLHYRRAINSLGRLGPLSGIGYVFMGRLVLSNQLAVMLSGLEAKRLASASASRFWPRPGLDLLLCNRAFFVQKSCKFREFC